MSDPPPSSTPSAPECLIFHHPDGQPVHVFVEAGGILKRPQLIRNLKKHGALISTDPKNAQVILVDAESWQGKEFIREWGMDQNKVVLDHRWVAKSISAARALFADDDWGGSKTRDDGLPILRPSTNGDGEDVAPKTLPTPRETPMDANTALPKRRKVSAPYSERLSIDKSLPRISTSPSPLESVQANSSSPHLPSYAPILSQQPQQQSQSTPTFSPTMSDVTSMLTPQQQAPPTVPFGMSNGIMPGFNMPLSMMPFGPQMLAMFAQQQQQTATPPITQSPAIMPQIQENFTTALVDIIKMYGAMPGGAPMGSWPVFPNPAARTLQQLPLSAGGSSGSGTIVREDSPASFGGKDPALPSLSSPIPESVSPNILSPSIKRKRKSGAQSDQDSSETDNDYGLPLAEMSKRAGEKQLARRKVSDVRKAKRTSHQNAAPQRSFHGQSAQPTTSGDPAEKLFVRSNGKSMQFFVQVDQNNRQEITRAIKKNGGTITSQILGADYAVLYTLSTTFKSLLTDAVVSGTPAVTHHFVLDAISQNSIPDKLSNYLFDTKQVSATRKARYSSAAEAEKKRLEKNAKQAERTKRKMDLIYNYVTRSASPDSHPSASGIASTSSSAIKEEIFVPVTVSGQALKDKASVKEPQRTSTPTPSVRKRKSLVGTNTSGSTLISAKVKKPKPSYYPKEKTPPRPTKPETHHMGFLYTQEEKEWVEKYLLILFRRDPTMSLTAVVKALHRHLPHHTNSSWSTFLATVFKAEYEEARKRGGISHRKEKSRWETEQQEKAQSAQDREQCGAKEKDEKRESGIKTNHKQQERANEKEPEDQRIDDLNALEATGKKQGEELTMQASEPLHVTTTVVGVTEVTSGNEQALTPDGEKDVNTVVQFFLDGGDQGEAEDVVWAKLAKQNPCKSMSEWLEFYNQHDEVIVARYTAACSQEQSN